MEPHWLEHALIALPIGVATGFLFWCFYRADDRVPSLLAFVAWLGGSIYYTGREIRDFEKGTVADGYDYSGQFAPMVSCALVFGVAASLANNYMSQNNK